MPAGTRGKDTQLTYDLAKRNAGTYTGLTINRVVSAFAPPDKKRAISLGTAAGRANPMGIKKKGK